MKTAAPSKIKISVKVEADLKPQSCAEPQLAEQCKYEPESNVVAQEPVPGVAAHDEDIHEAEQTACSQTPEIMNTTLDLLENSDADLPDSQDGVDDVSKPFLFLFLFSPPHSGNYN